MPRQSRKPLTPETAFAEILRKVRLGQGLSQEQLGFDSGHHRTYIGMLERGLMNPSLRTILSLAAALQVPAADLVTPVETALGKPWLKPEKKVGRRSNL